MNWLDAVIIVIGLLFGLFGLWKGAIKAAFSIAGLVGGIALAGHYYEPAANILSSSGAVWAKIAAYAIILIATLVVATVIGWFVAKLIHITPLGWLDRLIGFILGAGTGCMLCAAFLAIVSEYLPGTKETISQSAMAKLLLEQFPLLLALLPDEFGFLRDFFG
ncbi:MAG: CvpA family protein [Chloroflexota bacterium]|nr:CvpA family protein [Chloroflexota bacterium]